MNHQYNTIGQPYPQVTFGGIQHDSKSKVRAIITAKIGSTFAAKIRTFLSTAGIGSKWSVGVAS